MFRKFAFAAVVLCLSATSRVFAIGLGDIQIESSLNQPLKAVIQLTSGTSQELDELRLAIAPRDAFTKLGISRPAILDNVKFSVEQPQNGLPVIVVTTRQPVREPFLDLLIEASWSKGHLLRQYTLLVDPPVTMPAEPPAPQVPRQQTTSPAPKVRQITAPPVREPVASRVATPSPRAVAATGADKYGPVKRNETLWEIAGRVRPDSNVSRQQMMIALLRANPEAFADNNINNLKAGSTLQIPTRDEIIAMDKTAAAREATLQNTEWRKGRAAEQTAATTKQSESTPGQEPSAQSTSEPAPASAESPASSESRLQLVAPDEEAIKGAAVPGSAEAGTATTTQEAGSQELLQQLALATEEAEAGRAQTEELQSRVGKLEEQVSDMQRLIELKDEQLANLQNRLAAQNRMAATSANESVPATKTAEENQPAVQSPASSREPQAANGRKEKQPPASVMDHLLENPVLAGLGVLVAMVLGGFLWSSARRRKQENIFDDEPTLASQLAASRYEEPLASQSLAEESDTIVLSGLPTAEMSPLHDDEASDPLTEADVFIAYGRVQQAEEVIKSALEKNPDSRELKMKLLEVYHAAGNVAAFDTQAVAFREAVGEEDADWQRVAVMGYELSPSNPLYQNATAESPVRDGEVDFDMDVSGMEEDTVTGKVSAVGMESDSGSIAEADDGATESVDFNLDDLNMEVEDEDLADGLLHESDEIGTKLDLARAYMDMGDPEGARGILEEVIEEGNDDQKNEAETLISRLA